MTEERRKGGDPPSSAFQKVSVDESSSTMISSSSRRIIVKSADMKEDLQEKAIECAIAVWTFFFFLEILKFWFFLFVILLFMNLAGVREARSGEGYCRIHKEGVR